MVNFATFVPLKELESVYMKEQLEVFFLSVYIILSNREILRIKTTTQDQ